MRMIDEQCGTSETGVCYLHDSTSCALSKSMLLQWLYALGHDGRALCAEPSSTAGQSQQRGWADVRVGHWDGSVAVDRPVEHRIIALLRSNFQVSTFKKQPIDVSMPSPTIIFIY